MTDQDDREYAIYYGPPNCRRSDDRWQFLTKTTGIERAKKACDIVRSSGRSAMGVRLDPGAIALPGRVEGIRCKPKS